MKIILKRGALKQNNKLSNKKNKLIQIIACYAYNANKRFKSLSIKQGLIEFYEKFDTIPRYRDDCFNFLENSWV
jgi:hypothetical protein